MGSNFYGNPLPYMHPFNYKKISESRFNSSLVALRMNPGEQILQTQSLQWKSFVLLVGPDSSYIIRATPSVVILSSKKCLGRYTTVYLADSDAEIWNKITVRLNTVLSQQWAQDWKLWKAFGSRVTPVEPQPSLLYDRIASSHYGKRMVFVLDLP
jgi:hypothetical protein